MGKREYMSIRDAFLEHEGFSEEQKEFVNSLYDTQPRDRENARMIADFYLIRSLQEQIASNDKHSKRMTWLTIVIAVAAAVEAGAILFQALVP